jgi:hypothetical protein
VKYRTKNFGPGGYLKAILAEDNSYNALFDRRTGEFHRWGRTPAEDPKRGPVEILDLEISEGDCLSCPFCYKENGPQAHEYHMTLKEFETLLGKIPDTLTQIAFGITNLDSNPDFRAMAELARLRGVIPNYTFNGHRMSDEWADWTVRTCGAVACSVYNKNLSYDSIKRLGDAVLRSKVLVRKLSTTRFQIKGYEVLIKGKHPATEGVEYKEMTLQEFLARENCTKAEINEAVRGLFAINIHFMLSEETYDKAWEILRDRLEDPRLSVLNAIVFLAYKPKGRNRGEFTTITDIKKYKAIIDYCTINGISYGCDSCSAPMVLKAYQDSPLYNKVAPMIEPCESLAFSAYINCHGIFFPCSFTEGEGEWETGLDVLHCQDWDHDIWNHPRSLLFHSESCGSAKSLCPDEGCRSRDLCRRCITFPSLGCNV